VYVIVVRLPVAASIEAVTYDFHAGFGHAVGTSIGDQRPPVAA
jgi:hypothetical protein